MELNTTYAFALARCAARGALLVGILLASNLLTNQSAHAQWLGTASPQSQNVKVFDNVTCGAQISTPVPDLAMNSHFLVYQLSGGAAPTSLAIALHGSPDGTLYFIISNTATGTLSGAVYAGIWMPFVRAVMACTSGDVNTRITAWYVGTSSVSPNLTGVLGPASGGSFPCPLRANVSIAGAGDTLIITPSAASESVVLCHLSFGMTAAANVQIISGTGAACGTGTVTTYGAAYQNLLALALNLPPGTLSITFPAGHNVCLRVTGSTTFGGLALYAESP